MRVTAVVVTRNRRNLLEECLAAIAGQSHAPEQTIVIDNASTDDTEAFLARLAHLPGYRMVRLRENTGGAGGFAHGISLATQTGADLIWIMDDDCIPSRDALAELVKAAQSLDESGFDYSFVCSRVLDIDGVACNHPVPSRAKNDSGWPRWADLADRNLILVDECTFVSVALRADHVRRAGLPFREMFIWGDDTEYTHRLAEQAPGVFIGSSEVLHKRVMRGELCIHTEEAIGRLPFYRHHYRNRLYLFRHYFPAPRYAALIVEFCWDLLRLIGRGKMGRALLVGRGLMEGLFFRPRVVPVSGSPSPSASTDERSLQAKEAVSDSTEP